MRRDTLLLGMLLCLLLVGMVVILQPQPVGATAFVDVSSSHPYALAIRWLTKTGIVKGYPDGTFHPDQSVSRGEFLRMLLTAFPDAVTTNPCFPSPFPDVQRTTWFYNDICKAWRAGLVGGFPDGTFRPGIDVTFAEAAKIMVTTLGIPFTPSDTEEWFRPYITTLFVQRAIPTSVQKPSQPLTRGEIAELLYRLRIPDVPEKTVFTVSPPSPTGPSPEPHGTTASGTTDRSDSTTDLAPGPPFVNAWVQLMPNGSTQRRIHYRQHIREAGSSAREGVLSLTVFLPSGVSFLAGSGSSTPCASASSMITCSPLLPNQEMSLMLSVAATIAANATLRIDAQVSTSLEERNKNNNTSNVYINLTGIQ